MQFKEGLEQKFRWNKEGNKDVRWAAMVLDYMTRLFFNDDIMVTSAIRPKSPGKLSFHPLGQALDFRTKGKPEAMIKLWVTTMTFINRLLKSDEFDFKGKFTWVWEDQGGVNEHFHLQLRRGEPV